MQVLFGFILAFATGTSPAWDFLALDWRKYISQKSSMRASRLCLKAWSYTISSTSLSTWFQLSLSFAVKSVCLISHVNFSDFCLLLKCLFCFSLFLPMHLSSAAISKHLPLFFLITDTFKPFADRCFPDLFNNSVTLL